MKFAATKNLFIDGTLNAVGLSTTYIVFTSINDDSVGETIAGSSGNPDYGDWGCIYFDGSSSSEGFCEMERCNVKYGGFYNVYRLEGNYSAWVNAGYDIEVETYMDISAADLYQMMMDDPDLIVIDVSPAFEQGHLPGAVNYYVGDGSLDDAIPMLDPMGKYAVYCHVDSASILGAQKLIDAGFINVYRLEGNYQAWIDAGFDIEVGP